MNQYRHDPAGGCGLIVLLAAAIAAVLLAAIAAVWLRRLGRD